MPAQPNQSVIVGGARTPVGRFMGALQDFSGAGLGGLAIKAALERSSVAAADVDYVVMGQVLTAGAGQIPARQAATAAGLPMSVPAVNVNKVCLSGIDSIAMADMLIRAGIFDVVVAGGQESMTNAPHLLPKSRTGHKYGAAQLLDHLEWDGLWDSLTDQPMGALTETRNQTLDQISRHEQDSFAANSHTKAARAAKDGLFDDEIVPVTITRKGRTYEVTQDEGVRAEASVDSLGALRPAFHHSGTVTAGNASQLSDGACAVVVMNKAVAERRGLRWLAEITGHGLVAGPDSTLQSQPAEAIKAACSAADLTPAELDLVEINEAFAAVGIASTRELGLDPTVVNVNGGAIAIGHPLGMSGARVVLHLAIELSRRGGRFGAAALCGGGGQGQAIVLRSPHE
ncbi:acetyl-CoA C-acetyltransferase [Rhodococcus sp. WS4]|nr:acetyl-CoA C-acetyltransferase [Rhodococcus sp. WS4]